MSNCSGRDLFRRETEKSLVQGLYVSAGSLQVFHFKTQCSNRQHQAVTLKKPLAEGELNLQPACFKGTGQYSTKKKQQKNRFIQGQGMCLGIQCTGALHLGADV
ncbi:hypothetical protein XELAEV_18030473mg [Xenopus laevis]|uniref:Uncharacterized protein n=1 Tax=Xenopus laevis TaxID=8355 RepID=A0A974CKU3_XENLA|nr:hypothetical protein XELAEV_18030473mg [Xenopus laevis]